MESKDKGKANPNNRKGQGQPDRSATGQAPKKIVTPDIYIRGQAKFAPPVPTQREMRHQDVQIGNKGDKKVFVIPNRDIVLEVQVVPPTGANGWRHLLKDMEEKIFAFNKSAPSEYLEVSKAEGMDNLIEYYASNMIAMFLRLTYMRRILQACGEVNGGDSDLATEHRALAGVSLSDTQIRQVDDDGVPFLEKATTLYNDICARLMACPLPICEYIKRITRLFSCFYAESTDKRDHNLVAYRPTSWWHVDLKTPAAIAGEYDARLHSMGGDLRNSWTNIMAWLTSLSSDLDTIMANTRVSRLMTDLRACYGTVGYDLTLKTTLAGTPAEAVPIYESREEIDMRRAAWYLLGKKHHASTEIPVVKMNSLTAAEAGDVYISIPIFGADDEDPHFQGEMSVAYTVLDEVPTHIIATTNDDKGKQQQREAYLLRAYGKHVNNVTESHEEILYSSGFILRDAVSTYVSAPNNVLTPAQGTHLSERFFAGQWSIIAFFQANIENLPAVIDEVETSSGVTQYPAWQQDSVMTYPATGNIRTAVKQFSDWLTNLMVKASQKFR